MQNLTPKYMFRDSYRSDPKHYIGYRSCLLPFDTRSNDKGSTMITLDPLGSGRLANIREKVDVYAGQTCILDSSKKDFIVNPMWEYALFIMIAFQRITISNTPNQQEIFDQLSREFFNGSEIKYKKLQTVLKQHLQKTIRKVLDEQSRAVQKIMGKNISIFKCKRIQQLEFMKAWMHQKAQSYYQQIRKYSDTYVKCSQKTMKLIKSKKFISDQLERLRNIEPLKTSQQYIKFKQFQKQHSQYFQASIVVQKVRGLNNYSLKVAKISTQSQPVLQRLSEFVQLRFNSPYINHQYKSETKDFIKDLYKQIQRYESVTAKARTKMKPFYYYLDPECVIMDQVGLKPKLHFQPVIMNVFGLKSNSVSVQARLVFEPTPKMPDLFRSLAELDQRNQMKLQDPFYGNLDLYQPDKNKLTTEKIQEIQYQKDELQKLKERIQVQRFLLVAHYSIKGQQYGRCSNAVSNSQVEKHFKKKLKEIQIILDKNAAALKEFLGSENSKFQGSKFDWKLGEIGEFLQFNNDDSVIKNHKFDRKYRYFVLRWCLSKEIFSILRNKDQFTKVLNVKKYIIMYLLSVHQYFQESNQLLKAEKKKTGQRQLMRKIIENKPKQLKKQYASDAIASMNHINSYLTRAETDQHAKYLNSSDGYIKKLIDSVNSAFQDLLKINTTLNQIQNKQDRDRTEYKTDLVRLQQKIKKNYIRIKNITTEYVTFEINNRSLDQLTKVADQPLIREEKRLEWKKLVCLLFTIFQANQNNHYLYESTVAPLLIAQFGKPEQVAASGPKFHDEKLKSKLEAVEAAINLSALVPKQFQYLRKQHHINSNDQI